MKIPGFIGVMRKKHLNPKEHFKKGKSGIINLDDDGGGSHWISFYMPDDDTIWHFDSYGSFPIKKMEDWLNRRPLRRIYWSDSVIQHIKSRSCGWYAVDFLRHVVGSQNLEDFADFVYQFDQDPTFSNEKIIMDLIDELKYEGQLRRLAR